MHPAAARPRETFAWEQAAAASRRQRLLRAHLRAHSCEGSSPEASSRRCTPSCGRAGRRSWPPPPHQPRSFESLGFLGEWKRSGVVSRRVSRHSPRPRPVGDKIASWRSAGGLPVLNPVLHPPASRRPAFRRPAAFGGRSGPSAPTTRLANYARISEPGGPARLRPSASTGHPNCGRLGRTPIARVTR